MINRRNLLTATLAAPLVAPVFRATPTRAAEDPRMGERAIGRPNAPAVVEEYFSLTCSHCAAFHRDTMPRVKAELVDTGRLRIVFHDFPLDQVALTAAAVSRALPVDKYDPFITTLLANQNAWAFARDKDLNQLREELWRFAAAAGMARPTFDATVNDEGLKNQILAYLDQAQKKWNLNVTPSFVARGQMRGGSMSFENFVVFAGVQ